MSGSTGARTHALSLYLRELVDLFTDAVAQHDQHGHGHLHVALLGVVTQHLLHDGTEELRGQMR